MEFIAVKVGSANLESVTQFVEKITSFPHYCFVNSLFRGNKVTVYTSLAQGRSYLINS